MKGIKFILLAGILILFQSCCNKLTYENCAKIYKPIIIDKTFVITDTVKVKGDTIQTYIRLTDEMFLDSMATVFEDSIVHIKAHYNSLTGYIDTRVIIKEKILKYNSCDSLRFLKTIDSLAAINYARKDSIYEIVSEIKELEKKKDGGSSILAYILAGTTILLSGALLYILLVVKKK